MIPRSLKCPINPSIPPLSRTRQPGEGFYEYVNQNWLKKTRLESWRSETSVSDEIEDRTNEHLLKILKGLKYSDGASRNPLSAEDHLAWMRHIWFSRSWQAEEAYVRIWLNEILAATTRAGQAQILGQLLRHRLSTIISIEVQEEIKPPYVVRSSFVTGGLVLPNGYYRVGPENPTCEAYEHLVQTLALEYGIPSILDGMEAERRVAELMDTPFGAVMTHVNGSDLHSFCSDFDWRSFMGGWGIDSAWHQRTYLIDAPDRVKELLKWFTTAPMEQVGGMLALHVLVYASPYLRPAVKAASEALFQKALRGIAKGPSEDIQFLDDIKAVLPDALCIVYSKVQHNTAVLEDTKVLVEDIRKAAVDIMRKTKVFGKRTISKVVEKLNRMYFEIGKGPGDALPAIEYHSESFLHTCMSIFEARSTQMQTYIGRPSFVDHKSSYPCYVTNASYYSESNHIVIPWGILQWPFYCKSAPIGWNYGGIGATIAHEITHAFDMEGRLYNEHGVYKQWWTRRNRDHFIGRTRKVQKFFGKFKHYGMAVDGKRTLSENWADLGGVAIALNALKRRISGETPEKQREAYRNFFLSYAISWRTLVRKEKMLFSLQTSVHAPSADRVDGIVPHFQEWIDAFNVKEGDVLYLKPGERLKFF